MVRRKEGRQAHTEELQGSGMAICRWRYDSSGWATERQRWKERKKGERQREKRKNGLGLGQTVDYRLACLQVGVFASRSVKIGTSLARRT